MARLLLDTCVWGGAVSFLVDHEHDVIWTGTWEIDPGDTVILNFAHSEKRILVTLDKDFGEPAILKGLPHSGIIRLARFRVSQMATSIHYLACHYESELGAGAIITADPERVRVRPT